MKIIRQAFHGTTDLAIMSELVHAYPEVHLHIIDLPYRFSSWAFDDPENVCLWMDEAGKLVAWAVMQSPFWTVDIGCRPDLQPSDYQKILRWADNRAREITDGSYGRPAWFVPVFSGLRRWRAALESAGFADQGDVGENSWSKVFMAMPLPSDQSRHLAEEYTLRPLEGVQEVKAYVDLHQAVFESKSMTVNWRRKTLQQPAYRPDLDLIVQAPDGRLAAFCIGWFDPSGPRGVPCGQIEPLGVNPDFRGLGLAGAILDEVLRRFYLLGAKQAYVETDNYRDAAFNLYQSTGFRILKEARVYRKNFRV